MGITANNRLLPAWLTRVETGQIKLPQFQRWEAWSHANVALLFNTVLHDLPAGSVLVLEIGNAEPFPSRVITGAPDATERTTEHLLDGQQRLTALWRGLNNNYEERTYFLVLTDDDDEETGLPYFVDSVSRGRRKTDNQRMPLWVDQPAQQWERRMIPLDMLAPGDASPGAFRSWSEQAIPDIQERMEITDTAYKVRNAFSTFNLPYLSLPVQTEPHTALDVFIRTNTSATPLGDYDIVVALVQAGTGQSLHDMVADTRQECPEISRYYSPEDLALAAGALLQGRTPGKSTYLSSGFGDQLVANWDRYSQGVKDAAEFLADEKIFDADRLPTDIVVPVLVAIWADAPTGPDAKGRARTILSKYAWRAFFTKRYERSTATRSLSDYNELRRHIHDTQAPLPSIFDDYANPLPEINELVEAGWPKRKDRLGRAILALSLRHGGLDLADASPATVGNLPKREYHHLFPSAHLSAQHKSNPEIFRALNCALVSWKTNRTISAKDPERYLAERGVDHGPTVAQIKERLFSHLIPYDEMVSNNYDNFLTARSEMIHGEMSKLCG